MTSKVILFFNSCLCVGIATVSSVALAGYYQQPVVSGYAIVAVPYSPCCSCKSYHKSYSKHKKYTVHQGNYHTHKSYKSHKSHSSCSGYTVSKYYVYPTPTGQVLWVPAQNACSGSCVTSKYRNDNYNSYNNYNNYNNPGFSEARYRETPDGYYMAEPTDSDFVMDMRTGDDVND